MKKQRTVPLSGKFQLGTAIAAFVLMLIAYLMDIEGIYGSFLWPDYFIESTLCRIVDIVPFVLLLIFSIRQTQEEYRDCRSFPVAVLVSRCIVDIAALIFDAADVTSELTFDMTLEYSMIFLLIYLVGMTLAAAFLSRMSYLAVSGAYMVIYIFEIALTLGDRWNYSHRNLVWAAAYVMLHVSLIAAGRALNEGNRYFPKVREVLSGVLDEVINDSVSDETEGEPEEDYRICGTLQSTSDEGKVQERYILLRTPEEEMLILAKRMDSGRYEVVDDYEEEKEILAAYFRLYRQEPLESGERKEDE